MSTIKRSIGSNSITRREFLRLSSTGLLAAFGLALPAQNTLFTFFNNLNHDWFKHPLNFFSPRHEDALNPNQQGRILNTSADIFDLPSFSANRKNTYFRDTVLPITDITIGSSEDSFNMVWYKVGDEGYVHSGSIQPVLTIPNPTNPNILPDGAIAEVTVPFTDARWDPGYDSLVAYRFYYSTTYWVMEVVNDLQGNAWYGVRDDKWEYMYYVPCIHLRLVPDEELSPISPQVPPENKRIEVHLPEQVLIAYEFDQPVFMARVSSGAVFGNGDFSTPSGRYMTFHKRSSRHMARGNLAANGYDLPGVPWNSYITEEGIAFHGTYWHNNFGQPRSHGCINLTPQAAKWVFLWTMPTVPPDQEWIYKEIGTVVDIIS